MSSINTVSGRGGSVSVGGVPLLRIKSWSVTETRRGGSEWGDSDSGGYTNRSPGAMDCTFQCEGVYDTTTPIVNVFAPNDIAIVVLDGGVGCPGYNFPRAICTDFGQSVNADTEEVVGWTSSWGSDGTYTRTT